MALSKKQIGFLVYDVLETNAADALTEEEMTELATKVAEKLVEVDVDAYDDNEEPETESGYELDPND